MPIAHTPLHGQACLYLDLTPWRLALNLEDLALSLHEMTCYLRHSFYAPQATDMCEIFMEGKSFTIQLDYDEEPVLATTIKAILVGKEIQNNRTRLDFRIPSSDALEEWFRVNVEKKL